MSSSLLNLSTSDITPFNICDRTWEKGPIDVVDYFLFFYTFGISASLPHYGYLSERYKCFRR